MRVSVLIVEHATRELLPACLAALERSTLPRDEFEVIVVDNASPTPIGDLAREQPRVRFLTTRENVGFAGANALALGYARGEHVALLNPDAIPAPSWLAEVIAPLSDPKVGVVGSKILYPKSSVLQHAGGILHDNARSEHRGRGETDRGQFDHECDVDYVCGAAIALRRDVIERVGFLSPAYFPAYYEETELCVRARRAGYVVRYAPKAVVEHHELTASGGKSQAFLRHYHSNRIRFVLRNYSRRELARRFLPTELAFLLRSGGAERRICLRAYAEAWRSQRDGWRAAPAPDTVVGDSWK